jgi:multimeric flavodoxin WrbA
MKYLFVNGSPDKGGMTARLTAELLAGKSYETL